MNLKEKHTATNFYDQRYLDGYMEEWDFAKKLKVKEVILQLGLPNQGFALDFGCGNGVFTNIIKEVLPEWEVYGVEISQIAVNNAAAKFTNCHFFQADDSLKHLKKFDFVFSHHVLEHVQDMNEAISVINGYLKPKASQLHILPCGNEGSLEHQICMYHKNGIEFDKENRFFFEEPGHLRRLTTNDLSQLMHVFGFQLLKEYYTNQYDGAVNWITKSSPRFVKKLTNPANGKDDNSVQALQGLRKKLLPLTYVQFPYSKFWMIKSKWHKSFIDFIKLAFLYIPSVISKFTFDKLDKLAVEEWQHRKTDRAGSEMFLFFKRDAT